MKTTTVKTTTVKTTTVKTTEPQPQEQPTTAPRALQVEELPTEVAAEVKGGAIMINGLSHYNDPSIPASAYELDDSSS